VRTIFGSPVFLGGLALLVVGTGPLVASVLYAWSQGEANPNPVGPGILAMFTFWPAVLLVLIGLGLGLARYRRRR
jgi:hypothetical protein